MGERRGPDGKGSWRSGWHVASREGWAEGRGCNGTELWRMST